MFSFKDQKTYFAIWSILEERRPKRLHQRVLQQGRNSQMSNDKLVEDLSEKILSMESHQKSLSGRLVNVEKTTPTTLARTNCPPAKKPPKILNKNKNVQPQAACKNHEPQSFNSKRECDVVAFNMIPRGSQRWMACTTGVNILPFPLLW